MSGPGGLEAVFFPIVSLLCMVGDPSGVKYTLSRRRAESVRFQHFWSRSPSKRALCWGFDDSYFVGFVREGGSWGVWV